MNSIKNKKIYIVLPLLLAVTLALGILTGAQMFDAKSGKSNLVSSLMKFREILTYVERDYVDEVDSDKLVGEAITDMLENLDPHSVYIPAKDRELTNSQLEGEFDGIGIEFNIIKDTIYVVAPLIGGPSESVGIQAGDRIVKVNDETVAGTSITNRDVFDLLRGPKGTEVKVDIKRANVNELIPYYITRDKIPQYSVAVNYMVDDEIGYIKVTRFAATTYDEFYKALSELKAQGMTKLILDLQSNPGGYMDRAIKMVDEFVAGTELIVYTDGKSDRFDSEARARREGIFEKGPVVVLIDEGSASASEIVSGALQDNDRALVVGRRSFGKGLVQNQIPLSDGSELRLTISRYYIPSGRSIQRPYEGDNKDYHLDFLKRLENGEFDSADSIKFNDSLKYTTSKGRTVYGGGGIMPDHFVPRDTAMFSDYYGKIIRNVVFREYPLSYYQKNQKRLENMGLKTYLNSFQVNDNMLDSFVKNATKNGVEFDEVGFNRSKPLIQNLLKAQIARLVWDDEGFYPIINQQDEIFQAALKLFDDAEALLTVTDPR